MIKKILLQSQLQEKEKILDLCMKIRFKKDIKALMFDDHEYRDVDTQKATNLIINKKIDEIQFFLLMNKYDSQDNYDHASQYFARAILGFPIFDIVEHTIFMLDVLAQTNKLNTVFMMHTTYEENDDEPQHYKTIMENAYEAPNFDLLLTALKKYYPENKIHSFIACSFLFKFSAATNFAVLNPIADEDLLEMDLYLRRIIKLCHIDNEELPKLLSHMYFSYIMTYYALKIEKLTNNIAHNIIVPVYHKNTKDFSLKRLSEIKFPEDLSCNRRIGETDINNVRNYIMSEMDSCILYI